MLVLPSKSPKAFYFYSARKTAPSQWPLWLALYFLCDFMSFYVSPPLSLSSSHTGHTLTLDSLSSLFSSTFLLDHHEVIFERNPPWGSYLKSQALFSATICSNFLPQFFFSYFSLAMISHILCTSLSYHVIVSLLPEDKCV